MSELFIPQRTRDEIRSPAPEGQRHEQAKKIIFSLIGEGASDEVVFGIVRALYSDDFSDEEITRLIEWARAQNPQPCRRGASTFRLNGNKATPKVSKDEAISSVQKFLDGWHCTIADLWRRSSIKPSLNWRDDAALLIKTLYKPDELLNACWDFVPDRKKPDKAYPRGGGLTLSRNDWIQTLREYETPCDDAGCWFRINPVSAKQGRFVSRPRRCCVPVSFVGKRRTADWSAIIPLVRAGAACRRVDRLGRALSSCMAARRCKRRG
jgi:hypothetical protein